MAKTGVSETLEPLEETSGLDAIAALAELVSDQPSLDSNGLADQLLEFVMPRPRHPEALTQPRIVPLLGAAADLLRSSSRSQHIVGLGATALEQELRQHRALADRRATLIEK